MDKYLNNKEELLFDLIEQKQFDQLSSDEKQLVLSLITEEEFNLRKMLISTAPSTFEDEVAIPAPLVIPQSSTTPFWKKPIPLYQVFMAAAIVAFLWLVIPLNQSGADTHTEYIVQTDTVEVEKWQIDTVFQTTEKPIYLEREVVVDNTIQPTQKEEPRLLLPGPSSPIYLNENDISNNGSSLSGENSSALLPAFESENIGFRNL